jgi:hypothetical protein
MKKIITLFTLLISFNNANAVEYNDFGFKQYIIGKSKSELNITSKKWTCKKDRIGELCYSSNDNTIGTIAGQKIKFLSLTFNDENLSTIALIVDESNYDKIKSALSTKYGSPLEVSNNVLQNGYGVKFNSETLKWETEKYLLEIEQRNGKPDQTFIVFASRDQISKSIKSKEEENNKNSKDL